ncbi:Cu(I)-responsive transcriptional regulator [Paracoccus saliphilus]|uniref:Transcriptional regulator n=1 Tax=Paracoccus saliphilus TaxID=405559 RepID=A0AA45W5S4_9RHOB|nr:Cu(I)-responsive transcriptional regulator [Paracoccus saliphilus]WCR05608.1 Cu(I)-responsive transcriptional regulator [Paracoccus saliphilus]SIS96220.1 transcriptional regulator [Paracoccus saliphilus]
MNIGEAAETTGLPVKTIRYYEEIGLVAPDRGDNGYRDFSGQQLTRLHFLSQARSLGFSLEECRRLMGLYCDENRASRDVRDLAVAHLSEIREKIAQLQSLERKLQDLITECRGDTDPDCAILDELGSSGAARG